MQPVFSDGRDMLNSQDSEQIPKCFYMAAAGSMIVDHQWKIQEEERRTREEKGRK